MITFTGEYDPAVSNNINLVPLSMSTYLKESPLVLTFFPEGKFEVDKLFKTNVLPLSYNPTTATMAPSHPFELFESPFYTFKSKFSSFEISYSLVYFFGEKSIFLFPSTFYFINYDEVSRKCSEKLIFQPSLKILVSKSISIIQS